MSNNSDIRENEIVRFDEELMPILLMDRTRSNEDGVHNIIWATDNYVQRGEGYAEWNRCSIPRHRPHRTARCDAAAAETT